MAIRITSPQNPRVLSAIRLRGRPGRDEQQRMIIDGTREITRACQAGIQIRELFAEESCRTKRDAEVLDEVEQAGAAVYEVSPAVMRKLAYGDRDAGLVAVAETPRRALEQLSVRTDSVVAVLEGVEKPGNLGAVVRTADAARVSAVIVADGLIDLFNPNVIRASSGTIFSLPVVATTTREAMAWLAEHGFRILAARVGAPLDYWHANFSGRTAIVLGSESRGLSEPWCGAPVQAIALPQHGIADSLNVSVTAAVLFYEALRQRECGGHSDPGAP